MENDNQNEILDNLEQQQRGTLPIVVSVKNVADYTLKDVKVFDKNHLFERDLRYSGVDGFYENYDQFLKSLEVGHEINVRNTYFQAGGENASKQIGGVVWLHEKYGEAETCEPMHVKYDPMQQQINIVNIFKRLVIKDTTQIVIPLLHPNTTVKFNFYPVEKIKLPKVDKEKVQK